MHPWPLPVPVTDRHIDVLPREVNVLQRGADAQVNPRMVLGEPSKAMDEPLAGEVGRSGHGQHASVLALQQTLGSDGEPVKGIPHHFKIRSSRVGDQQALTLPLKQLKAEFRFECLDLMADRSLCDA